jgi:leader peptidase (prepilin peptidase)/N-methyltransferase
LQAIIGLVILMLVFWTDYWWLAIFTGPLLIGGVIVGLLKWLTGESLVNMVLGGLIGGLFFALQFWASKGRWIGEGDIYLGIFLGIWLGWPFIILAIFGAYIFGAIIGLLLIAMGHKAWTSKLPLGVFLAPSGWLCFLWGQQAMEAYLRLIGVAN